MASIGSLVGHGGVGMPASMICISVRVVSVQRLSTAHGVWASGRVRLGAYMAAYGSARLDPGSSMHVAKRSVSPRLVGAARCPVRCCHRRVRCCPRFRGRFTRWVLVSWARFTRWVPGGGLLGASGRWRPSWRGVCKSGGTRSVHEECAARRGLRPDRPDARCGRRQALHSQPVLVTSGWGLFCSARRRARCACRDAVGCSVPARRQAPTSTAVGVACTSWRTPGSCTGRFRGSESGKRRGARLGACVAVRCSVRCCSAPVCSVPPGALAAFYARRIGTGSAPVSAPTVTERPNRNQQHRSPLGDRQDHAGWRTARWPRLTRCVRAVRCARCEDRSVRGRSGASHSARTRSP